MAQGLKLPAHFQPTHDTGGLPGYGAVDNFASGGTPVQAPADGTVHYVHMIPWNQQKRVGGLTMYIQTKDGVYFLTHFGSVNVKDGQHIKAGQVIGTVAPVPNGWWSSHIHEGFHPGATSVPTGSGVPVTASDHATHGMHKGFEDMPGEGAGFTQIPDITGPTGFGPQGQNAQEGAYGLQNMSPTMVANIWQDISAQQNASPEARLIAANANSITDGMPLQ